jgi:hypothetical protein
MSNPHINDFLAGKSGAPKVGSESKAIVIGNNVFRQPLRERPNGEECDQEYKNLLQLHKPSLFVATATR